MDRGMVSQDNLDWLNQTARRYVIGTPKAELKRCLKQIAERHDWRQIRDDVEVKICRGPHSEETFLLCRSASRVDKERAMHERFKARIEAGLDSLERRVDKRTKALDRGAIERQIGRLLERNSRAAGAFSISVLDDHTHPSAIRLKRIYRADWAEWANLTEGVYVLRTNIAQWTDEALWQTYIQLTEAEAAFRVHKSDLAMRPIWHHKADRIKAHILICFIAYAMWKTLQQWQSRAGLSHSPRTILKELSRITAADIVLPLADDSKRELRIRCVVRPERDQQILLDHLGLQLPQRLKAPPAAPM
jgi:transposase